MRTLVLNAGYEPLAVVSFKRALVLVMNDKATVVESVDEDPVWAARGTYDRPAVTKASQGPNHRLRLSSNSTLCVRISTSQVYTYKAAY